MVTKQTKIKLLYGLSIIIATSILLGIGYVCKEVIMFTVKFLR